MSNLNVLIGSQNIPQGQLNPEETLVAMAPKSPEIKPDHNMINTLSKRYESAGDSAAIGAIPNDPGGTYYGKYQLITANLPEFLEHEVQKYAPGAYQKLKPLLDSADDPSGGFAQAWQQVAKAGLLNDSEYRYIERTHYKPQLDRMPAHIKRMIKSSPTLQNALWSTAVQHRNFSPDIFEKAWNASDKSMESFVREIYAERGKRFPKMQQANPQAWQNIQQRFTEDMELGDALDMLAAEQDHAEAMYSEDDELRLPALEQELAAYKHTKDDREIEQLEEKPRISSHLKPLITASGRQTALAPPPEPEETIDQETKRKAISSRISAGARKVTEFSKDLATATMNTPSLALDLAKGLVIDFGAYHTNKIWQGILASSTGRTEESVILGKYEVPSDILRDRIVENTDRFMRQIDRGYMTMRHPIHTVRFGEPPDRHPQVEKALNDIGVIFHAPREHVFQPLGDAYGRLVDNAVAGEMSADAMEVLFWVLVPYYAYKGAGRAVTKRRAFQDAQVKQAIELQHQRSQLVESLRKGQDAKLAHESKLVEQAHKEAARSAELQRQAYEARQQAYEKLFNEPDVVKFLDDVEAFLDRKKAGQEGPVTRAEVELLYQRWLERNVANKLDLAKDLQNWRMIEAEVKARGVFPLRDFLDRAQFEIGITGKGLPPGMSDLKYGVEAGRPYPKPTAGAEPLIVPGAKPFSRLRDTLGHKQDLSLAQKMRVPRTREQAIKEAQQKVDANRPAEQMQNLAEAGDLLLQESKHLPKPEVKPKPPKKQRPSKPQEVALDTLNELKAIEQTGKSSDGRPATVKTPKAKAEPAPAGRLEQLKAAAAKRQAEKQPVTKELSKEAKIEMQAQREADAYSGMNYVDPQPPKSPFASSLFDDTIRPLSEIYEDIKISKKDRNPQRGSFDPRPISAEAAAAIDRLMKDAQTIVRGAIHDGKTVAQWLLDNQWTVDPVVAQAVAQRLENATATDLKVAPPLARSKGGYAPGDSHKWFQEMQQAKADKARKARGLYGEVHRAAFSVDPDVRAFLMESQDPYGPSVYHKKISTLGANSQATMYLHAVEKQIYNKLNKVQKEALDYLVSMRTMLAQHERNPRRAVHADLGKHGYTQANIVEKLRADIHGFNEKFKLTDVEARQVAQAAQDYFGVTKDLLDMKMKAGALPEWLHNILRNYEYSPTIWLEIIERTIAAKEAGRPLDFTRPPRTLEELAHVTGTREKGAGRLNIHETGVEHLKTKGGRILETDSHRVLAALVAHTHNWVYGNSATQMLGRWAAQQPEGSIVKPAKTKGTQLELKGGTPKFEKLADGSIRYEFPDNPGAYGYLQHVKASKKEKAKWIAKITDKSGTPYELGSFDTRRGAYQAMKENLMRDVYGDAPFMELPIYQKPPAGFKHLHYFENGIMRAVEVPDWFHAQWTTSPLVMRNMTAQFIRTASGASLTRYFATGPGNPLFFMSSIPMDWMHLFTSNMIRQADGTYRSVYSPHLPVYSAQLLQDIGQVFWDVMLRKGRYADYFKDGGAFPFLTATELKPKARGKAHQHWDTVNDVLSYLTKNSEMLIRIAHRERLIKQGIEPWEASIIARDRLDYAQGGYMVKGVDTATPYANAAAQSMRAPARALKHNTPETLWKMTQLAMVAAALDRVTATYAPEVYGRISSHMEVGYWMLPTGVSRLNQWGEQEHLMFRARKDPTQTVITTAAALSMAAAMGDEPRFNQLLLSFLDMTPMLQKQPLPPAVKGIVAYLTGVDPLTGKRLDMGHVKSEHEWTQAHTSKLYKDIASTIGMSPDRFKLMSEQLLTRNNIWVEALTQGYSHIFDNVEQEQWSHMVSSYFMDNVAAKGILHIVRPGPSVEKREQMLERSREDNWILMTQNQHLDRLMEGHYLTGNVPQETVLDFIKEQSTLHGVETGDRLKDRYRLFREVLGLSPDYRSYWMALQARHYTPRGRGQAVADEYIRIAQDDAANGTDNLSTFTRDLGRLSLSRHPMIPSRDMDNSFWNEFGKQITVYNRSLE